jgi:hypothetical protein
MKPMISRSQDAHRRTLRKLFIPSSQPLAIRREFKFGDPRIALIRHHVNLDLLRYRLDSGRLLGATELRQALLQIIKDRRLKGGPVWTRERLLGRLRYVCKERNLPIEKVTILSDIKSVLEPIAHWTCGTGGFSSGPRFSIRDVLDDVTSLEARGDYEVRPWWLPFENETFERSIDQDALTRVLDEHYLRAQQCFDEVVRQSFSTVAHRLGFHSILPVRWRITVIKQRTGSETSASPPWPSMNWLGVLIFPCLFP